MQHNNVQKIAKKLSLLIILLMISMIVMGIYNFSNNQHLSTSASNTKSVTTQPTKPKSMSVGSDFTDTTNQTTNAIQNIPVPELVLNARKQIGITLYYDPAYVALDFPMGDVPKERGVCTDVVIRAYRHQNKDLQALVNADMKKAWSKYPKRWGLKRPDRNIDHRRVPNLRVFFTRHGKSLAVSKDPQQYQAGDIVTWKLGGKLPHIGIVSDKTTLTGRPLIIHNIGEGTQEEDVLFNFPITGHYRY